MGDEETLLTLLNSALAEKERRTVPQLGHSTDRRSMHHVSEVFTNDSVQVLMCFMCACKELSHAGYDKFGNAIQKGEICYRRNNTKALLQIIRGDPNSASDEAWN